MHRTIAVVAGGDREQFPFDSLGPFDFCIAADGGLDHADALGLRADLVVGDMDSVTPEALLRAEERGASIETHSREKDASDLELALEAALRLAPERVVVIGGAGGRVDHAVLTAALIASFATREGPRVSGLVGGWTIEIAAPDLAWAGVGKPGDVISLVPQGGDASGVTTAGLRFPLDDDRLGWGSSRGLSNTFVASSASVHLDSGTLLVLRPALEALLQKEAAR